MSISENAYFYGHYTNSLSPKGQAAIPKKFRDSLGEAESVGGFVLLPGQDNCLYLYTHAQFASVKSRVREIAIEKNSPDFFRSFMEEVIAIDTDNQGRFVIPQQMRDYARLKGKEIVFIGMDERIEIWDPEQRQSRRNETEADYTALRKEQGQDIFGI